jgi:cytochrome c oxidase assembly protein subunit 15
MIFAMVVIGGITRLTESGLSITEWKPVTGALPPLSADDWEREFALYRQIPQAQTVHAGITLDQFKTIYFWEYLHRLWGRLIGLVYAIPLVWFAVRRKIPSGLFWPLAGIFGLGALQGVIGWWMVTSGLTVRSDVSQYRLVIHFGLALVIYAATLWAALGLLVPERREEAPPRLRSAASVVLGLVFITALSGGFVAGLDAGLAYNTFPLMDGEWVPSGYAHLSPVWLNWFENATAVQFNHRLLAMTTFVACVVTWLLCRPRADGAARPLLDLLLAAACLQVALGIATLLLAVPVGLGALHQAGAVLLLTAATTTLRHAVSRRSTLSVAQDVAVAPLAR